MTAPLRETLNIEAPDELYRLLVAAHEGLGAADSAKLNAKLVLLLANHIGDLAVVRAAVAKAAQRDAPAR